MPTISARLPADLLTDVREQARREERSLSTVMRRAVTAHLNRDDTDEHEPRRERDDE